MRPSHEESTWETIRRLALGRELDTSCDALHRGLRVTCGSSAGSAHSVGTHPMHRRPFGTDIAKARSSSRRLVMDFGGSREVLLHLPHRPWLHYVRRGLDGCSAEIHVDDPPEARREPSGPRAPVGIWRPFSDSENTRFHSVRIAKLSVMFAILRGK